MHDAKPSNGPWTVARLRDTGVAAVFLTSFYVKIEPAPCDYLALASIPLFWRGGLLFSRTLAVPLLFIIPLVVMPIVSALGIFAPAVWNPDKTPVQYFVGQMLIIPFAVILAAYLAQDPVTRYLKIEKAYWTGGTIGAIIALLLFWKVEPLLTFFRTFGEPTYGNYEFARAVGGFKDPNVFSTWIMMPVITLFHAIMTGRTQASPFNLGRLGVMATALILAFSRGAWSIAALSSLLTMTITFAMAPTLRMKRRVLFVAIVATVCMIAAIIFMLSIPSLLAVFEDRFVLIKDYDGGENGRFGNQLNSIPLLMSQPLGFGPFQFSEIYRNQPHNTFINAFASGGWIPGLSYLLLVATNFMMCLQLMFRKSSVQQIAIPVCIVLCVMTMQGLQIDQDHWRHLYWLMGITWGLYGALGTGNAVSSATSDPVFEPRQHAHA